MYTDEVHTGVRAGIQYKFKYLAEEFNLEGVFIATIVSAIVLPSMLISAVAPFDKNSLQMKGVVRHASRVSTGYLLENFFNLFLYF